MTLLSAALLGIIEDAGVVILTLTEAVGPEEFFSSRITQHEVMRHMRVLAETAANVPDELKRKLIDIDWAGWDVLCANLTLEGGFERDVVWFGVRSLVPATLMWLRFYRKDAPEWFSPTP